MKKMYFTDKARESAIEEIGRQIDVLGSIKSGDLSYCDYRAIVKNLSQLRDAIKAEMESEKQ
jgi:hypothetical protein